MKKKTYILLVCAGGNSTSLLVHNMQKNLREEEDWHIDAAGYDVLSTIIGKYDYVLVAPQVRFRTPYIETLAEQIGGIHVLEIPHDEFASCDGERINNLIRHYHDSEFTDIERGKQTMSENAKSSTFMDKMSNWMMEYLVPVANKIGNQRHLASVRDGLTIMIPATIIGGFAILLAVPPIPATITEPSNFFYAFLLAWKAWAGANSAILMTPYQLTIGIISVYAVCGVSYMLAKHYKMDGLNNMISALLVYLVISGALDLANGSITVSRLGAGYMFSAMIVGLLVVEITRMFDKYNVKIKLPDSVPPNVAGPFNVLIALGFNVIFFSIVNALLTSLTGGGIPDLIYAVFTPLMKATGSLPSILILNFLAALFWFFGIHGNNMMSAVVTPITTAAIAANAEAMAAGAPLPYIYAGAITTVFGGWLVGNNAMNLWCLLFAKSSRIKSLSKVAAVPAFFNIAEPYIFGLPTVLNLYNFIPAMICQTLNITIYYFLASANIVGRAYVTLPFTCPAVLQAFLATGGNVATAALALALLPLNMLIFTPFLKAYDNSLLKEEKEAEANK